ncbi:NADH dehydrogenase [ubiquinone] 1 alpha subcomplex assembly factor 8 [Emydura macquarii macquarii]|uniref:NADH dehydrogenase [ubiquinone] 1 alpha subcomplex assembly factor 8 n=1 Tax=Emydura macquarii macquarii TaxID=1129001 RepID=UPI00352ACD82
MSGQGVWLRARERLRRFPELLAGCRDQVRRGSPSPRFRPARARPRSLGGGAGGEQGPCDRARARVWFSDPQAAAYGQCVAASGEGRAALRRDACAEEFQALQRCFRRAAKRTAR